MVNLCILGWWYFTILHYLPYTDWVIEGARRDENRVLQRAMISWVLRHIVTSASGWSPNHQMRSIVACSWKFFAVQEYAALTCLWSVFGLATDVPDVSTKLHKTSWRQCKVILRTSFMLDGKKECKWVFVLDWGMRSLFGRLWEEQLPVVSIIPSVGFRHKTPTDEQISGLQGHSL